MPTNRNSEYFWALKDVSFDVQKGDVVGIIGRNGAGKSTLLKILSRITDPTEGHAEIYGRVGSLLEVGTGFHPELTGRENIYLSGSIIGMKKSEIDSKFDDIVKFAETEQFLDTPVKHYSSGMQVRLGFAVAAHLEPEILIVDEVLAVGDIAFQKKCLGKMEGVAKEGRTVLFVSHNLVAVNSLCNKSILLENGRIVASGNTNEIIEKYAKSATSISKQNLENRKDRSGDGKLIFTDIKFLDAKFNLANCYISGQDVKIAIAYKTKDGKPLNNVYVAFSIKDQFGTQLTHVCNETSQKNFDIVPSRGYFVCSIPKLPLVSGLYRLNIMCQVNGIISDWVVDTSELIVEAGDFYGSGANRDRDQSIFLMDYSWSISDQELSNIVLKPNSFDNNKSG